MLSPLQQLLNSYEENLSSLAEAGDVSDEQVIEMLLIRDSVQLKLGDEIAINPRDLQKLVDLDQRLKQEATVIKDAVALESIRASYKPKAESWWWLLDQYLPEQADEIRVYELAIEQIHGRDIKTFLPTLVEALLIRDNIQRSLEHGHLVTPQLLRLSNLDEKLNRTVKNAYKCQTPNNKRYVVDGLEKARELLNPNLKAWWWFPHMSTSWLNYFDPIWTTLTIIWLASIFELLTDIATRLIGNGSPGTFGSIAIIFQSLLALLGGGVITQKGQATVDRILSRWNMPRRIRKSLIFAGATVLLLFFVWFRISLPKAAISYNNSALNDYSIGNLNSATSKLERAIELDPDYETAHYNLGVIYEELGQYQKAKVEYELAIAGASIPAFNNKARLLILEEDYKSAVNLLNKGMGLAKQNDTDTDPANDTSPIIEHDLWKNLGWAEYSQGSLNDAEKSLKLAIDTAKSNDEQAIEAAPYCLLAQTYEAMDRRGEAQLAWKGCIEYGKDPDNPEEDGWQKLAKKRLGL